jgi:hypothetical protein
VSVSEPEARQMRQADDVFAANYNVQISADGAQSLIVDVKVTQAANDREQLAPAVGRIAARLGHKPQQIVADGDYTNRRSVEAMAQLGVDYISSLRKGGDEKDCTGTGRFTPPRSSSMTPSRTTRFAREASTCATPDGTNASRGTWFFATQRPRP